MIYRKNILPEFDILLIIILNTTEKYIPPKLPFKLFVKKYCLSGTFPEKTQVPGYFILYIQGTCYHYPPLILPAA